MSLEIPPELRQFIQQELATGEYQSEEELVRAGLHLLREQKQRLEQLRNAVRIGRDQLDNGDYKEFDEQSLRKHFDEIQAGG